MSYFQQAIDIVVVPSDSVVANHKQLNEYVRLYFSDMGKNYSTPTLHFIRCDVSSENGMVDGILYLTLVMIVEAESLHEFDIFLNRVLRYHYTKPISGYTPPFESISHNYKSLAEQEKEKENDL